MAKPSKNGGYEVGHKKPPKHTQFKPGQSGNPKGKPKQIPTVAELIAVEAAKLVTVKLDGQAQKLPQAQIMVKALYRKAMGGDIQAARLIILALSTMPDTDDQATAPLSPHEWALLMDITSQGGLPAAKGDH